MTVRVSHTVGSREGSSAACFSCVSEENGATILFASAVLGLEVTRQVFAVANKHDKESPGHDVLIEFLHLWTLNPYQK